MKFQGNSSQGSRDTGEKSLVYQVKYPYILTDSNQTYPLCSVWIESMKFQEIPPTGAKILPKRYFVLRVVFLITARSHPNLHHL